MEQSGEWGGVLTLEAYQNGRLIHFDLVEICTVNTAVDKELQ